MKITSIDIYELYSPVPQALRPIVCRVFTDTGLYGDGEAGVAYGCSASAAFGQLEEYARLVIGMDPLETEVIWNKLHRETFWGVNGGAIVFSAISAIDMACWDIKGKYFGVPMYTLLGGKVRDHLRTYASQIQFGWSDHFEIAKSVEDYANNAKKAVAEGYDCIKVDCFTYDEPDGRRFSRVTDTKGLLSPYYLDLIERRICAIREAIGDNVDIIIENHSATDANNSVQIANRVAKYNIFAFEEPNSPSPVTSRFLRDKIQIPLANGERIFTRWQYLSYFNDMSIHLIQPDIGNCGGPTEVKKICDMAHAYDAGVQIHVCASPLSTAAALHMEASIPNFVIHEHHRYCLFPWVKEYCKYDYQPVNGRYKVPELPGLGNEFTDEALAKAVKKSTIQ